MASTFTTHMNLELMKKGEKANAWGTITNDNLSAIDAEFGLLSQDSPDGTALTRNDIFVGQKVFATSERTMYVCTSATSTASTGFTLLRKINGIDATAATGVVVDITGGSNNTGFVSVSGGMQITGTLTVGALNVGAAVTVIGTLVVKASASFAGAIHVQGTVHAAAFVTV